MEVAKDDQREKEKAKTKEFFFPIDAASYYVFSAKKGMVRLTSFLRKYEMIEDFVCCQKFPIKENSRAWAWALEQNIMGLSFEHTQLILKHTQHQ